MLELSLTTTREEVSSYTEAETLQIQCHCKTDRQIDWQAGWQAGRLANRQTDRQAGRQPGSQTGR